MTADQLYREGNLQGAIDALVAEVRSNPTDARRRTFLFELLAFAGEFDRAGKQLDVVAMGGNDAGVGALLYRSALHAEKTRLQMFRDGDLPGGEPPSALISGSVNGKPFTSIADADPRIGARLEVFAAGQYTWLPLAHIGTITIAPPTRARDLLWAPAIVRTGPAFAGTELGEVLLPMLAPLSFEHDDDQVRLGRSTDFYDLGDGVAAPVGQKLLVVDEEDVPFLELRELSIDSAD